MERPDDATDCRLGHPAHQRRRTALIVLAVIGGLVVIGAIHLLGANPHAG
ncbi:MAG TPA: hypothetical protein VM282_21345 [Acidimicrobiales bacterium]|nr:hypothetical protein [Acidimicrobiales bacterium]